MPTTSLVDIANSRPDVLNTAKAQGGDPFTAGTAANNWLNSWWNTAGKNEYSGVNLVSPEEAKVSGTFDFSKAPTNQVSTTGAVMTQNTVQKQIDDLNKQIKTYQDQQKVQAEQASKESAGLFDRVKDAFTQRQAVQTIDTQSAYTQALSQYGFTPDMFTKMNQSVASLETLNKQIADLETEKQTRLMNNDNRQAPMDFIEGEGLKIERAYAIKKSGLAAQANAISTTLEALRGNLTQANQLASQTVQNLVYDRQQKVSDLEWSFTAYNDLYNSLSTKEQNAWKNVYDSAVNELNSKKEDYTSILNLMIQYPDAGWPTDISSLSLADASQIAQQSAVKTQAFASQKAQLENQMLAEQIKTEKAQQAKYYADAQETTNTQKKAKELDEIQTKLINSQGNDGYADPDIYQQLKSSTSSINATEFDKRFSSYLSPQQKSLIGAGGKANIKDLENAKSGLSAIQTLENEIARDPSILAKASLPGSFGARKFATARNEVVDVLARLRTGAALTTNEEDFYKGQLPNVFDQEETVKYKLNLYKQLFNRLSGGQAGSNDPLGIR